MAVKLAEADARSRSNTHRLDKLEGKVDVLNRLAAAVEVMAAQQRSQSATMGEIKQDVTALGRKVDVIEGRPGRRWDGLVDKLIYVAAGAFFTWLLTGAPGAV